MARRTNDLAANHWDESMEAIKSEHRDSVARLRADVMADGRPPGFAELKPHEQLQRLEAMRDARLPEAMTPEAQKAYERLSRRVRGA